MRRRTFLGATLAAPAFKAAEAVQDPASRPNGRLKIRAVEIWRVEGRRETVRGINNQYQAQAIHIYDEFRPAPYRDDPAPKKAVVPTSALYLKIKTDAGLEGIYGPIDKEAAIVVDQQLSPFLIGRDPIAIEALWDQMHRSNRHSRAGHFEMGVSAVDNTLWDLRGRYFNVPVYRLLGGPTRPFVEAYGSTLGSPVEPAPARARAIELKKAGFTKQKWFLPYGPGSGAGGLKQNVELVKAVREAAGDDVDLMFDAYMGWDLNYAISWAKQVEQYRPRWIEEAFAPEKISSFAELRRSTTIPVASGEHIYNRWEAQQYMSAGALNVIQCDPEWCGGVSELVKICALASVYDVHVAPHGHSIHTALHVAASQSPMTCPMVEDLIIKMQSYYHFEKDPPVVENGRIALPERPGFGITLDPAKVEKQTLVHGALEA